MTVQLDPTRTALLVMDYQAGHLARRPDAAVLAGRADAAVAEVRSRGGHIGWVRGGFDDSDFDAIPPWSVMARMAPPDRRAELHADAASSQIDSRLSPQPQDIAVRKTRIGAFSTTDLDQQLRDRTVNTVILAGLSTSGVVLSTVREAMDRDYRIVVLSDACADRDADAHAFLIGTIFARHARIITVSDLPALWA